MSKLLTPERFWNHWEGHRRVTLRTIEAYPEEHLFSYRQEPMRTFVELMSEIVQVEDHTLECMQSGVWKWEPAALNLSNKADLLKAFAKVRAKSQQIFPNLNLEKLNRVETDAWGMTVPNLERLFYLVDNEIHHRAQGYVYLRQLGVEPPAFYDRS